MTKLASCNIKRLSNRELLFQTKLLVQKERDIHIQVLRHFAEIDSRKLFFKLGFSSLFDYAIRELGYSEGAAYRRIQAMKLCKELPETADRLQSGKLSLSVASQLQVFFEKQDKKLKEAKKQSLLNLTEKGIKAESAKKEVEKEQALKANPEDKRKRRSLKTGKTNGWRRFRAEVGKSPFLKRSFKKAGFRRKSRPPKTGKIKGWGRFRAEVGKSPFLKRSIKKA